MNKKQFLISLVCVAIFTLSQLNAYADEYIKIIKDGTNIRFKSTTSSIIIGKANKGDVYELNESKNEWYGIFLFSGEQRYVHKALAKRTNDI